MPVAPVGAAPLPAAGAAPPRPRFAAALAARASRPPSPSPSPSPSGGPGRPGAAAAALASVERAQVRLDQVLAAARAGRTFTSGELLALQGEAYRCAQVVDLGAKLVEQGAQSVKQALATQV
jgi:hypothetical protein